MAANAAWPRAAAPGSDEMRATRDAQLATRRAAPRRRPPRARPCRRRRTTTTCRSSAAAARVEARRVDVDRVRGEVVGHARARRPQPLGEAEAERELLVVPRRPHRDRDRLAADPDLERLLDGDEVGSVAPPGSRTTSTRGRVRRRLHRRDGAEAVRSPRWRCSSSARGVASTRSRGRRAKRRLSELHAAPGNPGIAALASCHPVQADDHGPLPRSRRARRRPRRRRPRGAARRRARRRAAPRGSPSSARARPPRRSRARRRSRRT